jgi:nucleoside triphosphatase
VDEQKYPIATVGALVFNPEGKVILLKSDKWKGKYVVPGGHIELGETILDALRREIKEETNLDVRDIKFVCHQEFIYDEAFAKPRHYVFLDYACRTDSEDVRLNEEAQSYEWVTLEEALTLPIDPYTRKLIETYQHYRGTDSV